MDASVVGFVPPMQRTIDAGARRPPPDRGRTDAAIVTARTSCYFQPMNGIRRVKARAKLPTSESFAKLSDHARLPGRFFYRFIAAAGR
ncbi:hypothetical protein [Aurantimonas sp. VKM B-3413]|uniref:hypothetical protein n=1 Tax=Aurantimonas sp. VKM B-3413 TaxID=2779401 RepID=UPI001E328938|nr:hypothetical protein [Aurantimonas sp. VKM B-3413]MCB8838688.1 hypothetical protein [Aurantimonas sp. VKM B-3413]